MKNNNFIILMGKSGSGKTEIANELYKKYGLSSVVSYTTRPRRNPQEDNHIFISDEEFDELTDMVAYTNFNGYRYCATQEQVDENFIYTLDVAGIEYFDECYQGDKRIIVIYIDVPDDVCLNRMIERDGMEQAFKRSANDKIMFKDAKYMADYIVSNDDGELDNAVEAIYKIWRKK